MPGLQLLFCIILLFVWCADGQLSSTMNYLMGTNQKCQKVGWPVQSFQVNSKIQCTTLCSMDKNCGGINWNGAAQQPVCELLPFEARIDDTCFLQSVPANGWSIYTKKLLKAYFKASSNSVCMPYDPLDVILASDNGFACTANPYIVNLWNNGFRNCRFKKIDFKDFGGHDVYNITASSTDACLFQLMNDCENHNCLSVVTSTSTTCWMKYENHLTLPSNPLSGRDDRIYWYATCN